MSGTHTPQIFHPRTKDEKKAAAAHGHLYEAMSKKLKEAADKRKGEEKFLEKRRKAAEKMAAKAAKAAEAAKAAKAAKEAEAAEAAEAQELYKAAEAAEA